MFWGPCWVMSASNGVHVLCIDLASKDKSAMLSKIDEVVHRALSDPEDMRNRGIGR
ncbi:hypothetical protein BMS3Bbin12_01830 [bacterium BMS3Bbin12]|nr:hypothetical protein BMS3Bbin12_01830 [bacterium BMS3Bbin12]GBE51454.1 hypothetical protein BMS3Bbin13_02413 [bacterium BMS3Bbin13]